jgi:hypothetical protein
MDEDLHLLPPDQQDALYDRWVEEGGIEEVPVRQIAKFLKFLERLPSREYTLLQANIKQLSEMGKFLI